MKKNTIGHLISACLLGDSEIVIKQNKYQLYAYIDTVKFKYLERYIIKNDLINIVDIFKHKNQIIISHISLESFYKSWYQDSKKIFSKRITPYILEYESVILYIILFGKRQVEGIKVATNIDKNYLMITTYCVQSHIQTNLNPGDSYLKILDVVSLIEKNYERVQLIELVELFQYLTRSELKKLGNKKYYSDQRCKENAN